MTRRPIFAAGAVALVASVVGISLHFAQGQDRPPASLRNDPVSFRDVVKTVLPAVVTVDSKSNSREFRRFMDDLERPQRNGRRDESIGFGSGVIVDTNGIVLTNFHVVRNADFVEITLHDGRKFTSKDIKGDERTDLAIVRFDTKGAKLPWLEFGDSSQMEIGDRVLAIGAPYELAGSVTHGIISAKGRNLGTSAGLDDYVQTDAAINPGNSGGPLVNLDSKVVGINSAIKSRSGGFQGIGMAISSNVAKTVMQNLIRDGVVKRPYLGIQAAQGVSPDGTPVPTSANGVIVDVVRKNSPAAKGGLKAADEITNINGTPVKNITELQKVVANLQPTQVIDVAIIRDSKPMTVKITLEPEPENYFSSANREQPAPRRFTVQGPRQVIEGAGIEVADLTPRIAQQLGVKQRSGAVITGVARNGAGEMAGLGTGMVILKVDKKTVESAADAKDLIEQNLAGNGVQLQVQLGDDVSEIFLQVK